MLSPMRPRLTAMLQQRLQDMEKVQVVMERPLEAMEQQLGAMEMQEVMEMQEAMGMAATRFSTRILPGCQCLSSSVFGLWYLQWQKSVSRPAFNEAFLIGQ